ncbi:hypothetical protein XELAEV_18012269mg [Xenopus laevis]|uniref:GIY-YIG domain-containing protein n=1 Tax=Xenopus laevis TaxID=8355 RepID=A0A974DM80_XENLA|nr:hypothetical protein XELAEV_18012269mg [Xenopus laevis]
MLSPSLFTESDTCKPTNWLTTKGSYRCGVTRCGTCHYMRPSKHFKGRSNQRTYNINFYANWGTSNIIYLITCECGLQYVGKTTRPFRKHFSKHLSCVTRFDLSSAAAKHLIECHNNRLCITTQIIDRVITGIRKGDTEIPLLRKEAFCSHKLNTIKPYGLNREWELSCYIDS